MTSDIRIAIIDDQTLLREGLAVLLGMMSGLTVVGTAEDAQSGLVLVEHTRPDVALIDIRMPGMNGIALTRVLATRCPATRVLMLTTFDDDTYLFDALKAGAAGYLLKNANPEHLAAAIRAVHAGRSVLDPGVTGRVIERMVALERGAAAEPALIERLTARERAVLARLAEGLTNAEIGQRLGLAEGTVKNHITQILEKLGVRDRTQAARRAVEWGLVD